jgi:hypothetical protein
VGDEEASVRVLQVSLAIQQDSLIFGQCEKRNVAESALTLTGAVSRVYFELRGPFDLFRGAEELLLVALAFGLDRL